MALIRAPIFGACAELSESGEFARFRGVEKKAAFAGPRRFYILRLRGRKTQRDQFVRVLRSRPSTIIACLTMERRGNAYDWFFKNTRPCAFGRGSEPEPVRRHGGAAAAPSSATVAFLMPDQGSTRYEEHDLPGFVAEMKKLCPSCKVLYQNAERRRREPAAAVQLGHRAGRQGHRARPGRFDRRRVAGAHGAGQGIKVIAYDRPVPDAQADYYVSFDNEASARRSPIARRASEGRRSVAPATGGVLEDQRLADRRGRGPDQEGHPRRPRQGGGYKTLAEYDTPNWPPPNAQQWASGQITRFGAQIVGVVAANDGTGGGAIAAFKAAGVNPVPPVTGNDATIAGLAADHRGRPVQHDLEAERDRRGRRRRMWRSSLLNGETPKAETTLYDTPSQLFVPAVVTAEEPQGGDHRQEARDAAALCSGRYADGCKKLGITP